MIKLLISLFCFCFQCVFCLEIDHYLKKIPDKTEDYSMGSIDCVYMINLDERPEKFEKCLNVLMLYGIVPLRFSAVNGWELSMDAINDLGVECNPWVGDPRTATCYLPENNGEPHHEPMSEWGRTYFCHCMARGSIGIVLSHLSILQDAFDSGYETIWVMEDDVDLIQNPHILSDLVDELNDYVGKDGWDILFTDRDTKNSYGQYVPNTSYAWRPNFIPDDPGRFAARSQVGNSFRSVGARFGAYSMIVNRPGMKKLLDFIKEYHIFVPYDIDYALPPGMRLFTVLEDVVSTQPGAPSDNGGPNYLKSRSY